MDFESVDSSSDCSDLSSFDDGRPLNRKSSKSTQELKSKSSQNPFEHRSTLDESERILSHKRSSWSNAVTYFFIAMIGLVVGGYFADQLSRGKMNLSLRDFKKALHSLHLGG